MKQIVTAFIKNNRVLYFIAKKIQLSISRPKRPISGKNNIIINRGTFYKVKFNILGNNNYIEINKAAYLSNVEIYMRGDNHRLIIGENCRYRGGEVWFEDNNCHLYIGRNTSIESAHLAVTEPNRKIIIGEDCMLSSKIEFRTGDSHSIIDNETRKRINWAKDIIVGDHVWIGAHVIILKGVIIGNNSIIGTNSLVTKSISNNSIAAGIPAKVVRDNVDWVRERI